MFTTALILFVNYYYLNLIHNNLNLDLNEKKLKVNLVHDDKQYIESVANTLSSLLLLSLLHYYYMNS